MKSNWEFITMWLRTNIHTWSLYLVVLVVFIDYFRHLPVQVSATVIISVLVVQFVIGEAFRLKGRSAGKKYGNVLGKRICPAPLSSMLLCLKEIGVQIDDVKSIDLQCYDLVDAYNYFATSSSGKSILAHKIDVRIYGFIDSDDRLANVDEVKFFKTKDRLVMHNNLIHLKNGHDLLWHEPYHVTISNHHFFKGGAFLIQPKDEQISADIQAANLLCEAA